MSIDSTVIIPSPFLLKLKKLDSLKEIRHELGEFANNNDFHKKEVTYVYIRMILKNGSFFEFDREIVNTLLFEAAQWASTLESKSKTKPKKFEDVREKRSAKPFTKLLKHLINALVIEFHSSENDNIKFDIELSDYLEVMYELSCIKRDRNKILN